MDRDRGGNSNAGQGTTLPHRPQRKEHHPQDDYDGEKSAKGRHLSRGSYGGDPGEGRDGRYSQDANYGKKSAQGRYPRDESYSEQPRGGRYADGYSDHYDLELLLSHSCPRGCPHDEHAQDTPGNTNTATEDEIQAFLAHQEQQARLLYSEVKVAAWQTRLLRIDPASREDVPLHCRLFVADVTYRAGLGLHEDKFLHEVSFEALSYTWGLPIFSRTVQVNGTPYPVTANLEAALRALRRGNEPRLIWIDALCINQYDLTEKAIQVRRMQMIYEKARRVVLWEPWPTARAEVLDWALDMSQTHTEKHSAACLVTRARVLHAAANPPSLKRMWVRQEMSASRRLVFKLGQVTIDSDDISSRCNNAVHTASSVLYYLRDQLEEDLGIKRSWKEDPETCEAQNTVSGRPEVGRQGLTSKERRMHEALTAVKAAYAEVERFIAEMSGPTGISSMRSPEQTSAQLFSLLSLRSARIPAPLGFTLAAKRATSLVGALACSHLFGVTDVRDVIYAVVGCTNVPTVADGDSTVDDEMDSETGWNPRGSKTGILEIDYRQTPKQVFESAAIYLIERSATLDVLCFADYRAEPDWLPSWLPDWREIYRCLPKSEDGYTERIWAPPPEKETPKWSTAISKGKRGATDALHKLDRFAKKLQDDSDGEHDFSNYEAGRDYKLEMQRKRQIERQRPVGYRRLQDQYMRSPGSSGWRSVMLAALAEYDAGEDGDNTLAHYPEITKQPLRRANFEYSPSDGRLTVYGTVLATVAAGLVRRDCDDPWRLYPIEQADWGPRQRSKADEYDDDLERGAFSKKAYKSAMAGVRNLRSKIDVPVGHVPGELKLREPGFDYMSFCSKGCNTSYESSMTLISVAMLPRTARPGDLVVHLAGGRFPFILRSIDDQATGPPSSRERGPRRSPARRYRLVGMAAFPLSFALEFEPRTFTVDVPVPDPEWNDLRTQSGLDWEWGERKHTEAFVLM